MMCGAWEPRRRRGDSNEAWSCDMYGLRRARWCLAGLFRGLAAVQGGPSVSCGCGGMQLEKTSGTTRAGTY